MPCYNCGAVDSFQQEGGEGMDYIATLFVSVAASVISYYICKWLNRDK